MLIEQMPGRRPLRPTNEILRHFRTQVWRLTQADVAAMLGLNRNEQITRREYPPDHEKHIELSVVDFARLEDARGDVRGTMLRWGGYVDDPVEWDAQVRTWTFLAPAEQQMLIDQINGMLEGAKRRAESTSSLDEARQVRRTPRRGRRERTREWLGSSPPDE